MKFWNGPFMLAVREILAGYKTYKQIKSKYGEDAYIFFIRGKTGDIYLYFRFLEAYIEKNNITNYIFTGDGKGITSILKLYPKLKAPFVPIRIKEGNALQKFYCFLGANLPDMTLSLMWDVGLPYNRCTIRMIDRFNFIDSYYWFLFDLDRPNVSPTKACFRTLDNQLKRELRNRGMVPGRTVIISPYAYCVKAVSPLFWILLAKDLEMRGYKVFVMLEPRVERNEFKLKEIFFSYEDSAAVLEYAGHFIGLRSGFCDIVSDAKCNKVILYPTRPIEFFGAYHRGDIEYSGLKNMELCDECGEYTGPFIRNIGDPTPQTEDIDLKIEEETRFINEILERFPVIM